MNNDKPSSYPSINVAKAISRAKGRMNYLISTFMDGDEMKWGAQSVLDDLNTAQHEFDKMLQEHRADIKKLKFKEIYNKSPFQVN